MINRELLQKVLTEKRAQQARNEELEENRVEEISKKSPEIASLLMERRQAIFHGLKLALEGIVPQGIEEDTLRRNEQLTELLSRLGYPPDYLSPDLQLSFMSGQRLCR